MLWARDWALVYGSTAVGTAVVLAVYFTGLALGAAAASRLGGGRRSLRLYAGLEAGLATAVVGYLAVRPLLPAMSLWLVREAPASALPAARFGLALAVLGIPTTLIGAMLPAATATLPPGTTPAAGRLYAWNTLGGALGALLCGLVSIRALGVCGTFIATLALDLTVAGAALVLARRRAAAPDAEPAAAAARPAPPVGVLLVAAAAGFAGLAGEVLWARGLAAVLSNSVYSVAFVLAALLGGLVLGARLGAARAAHPRPATPRLAAALSLLALAIVASRLVLPVLPRASLALARAFRVEGGATGLAIEALLALLVVLVPGTGLGATFALTLALAGGEAPGRTMGRVLAANTVGGIAGALGAAFVLLPHAGLGGGLLLVAAVPAAAAAALAGRTPLGAAAGLGSVAAVIAATSTPALRLAGPDGERLLFHRDGPAATVTVTADRAGAKRLRINGQYSLGGTAGLLLERRAAHVPLLLQPAPRRVLFLGVGTGDTVGAAATHPGLYVDGVEIVPEALEAAALFAAENGDVLANPRVRLVTDDARSHLLSAAETYDVIVSDLFLPWMAGTAYLYSLDFYRLGLAHLRPGGLYCQWLPLHQLAVADLETIVATFVAAFPEVRLWVAYHRTPTPLAALIGSAAPVAVHLSALGARMAEPRLAPALVANGLGGPRELAALYVTDAPRLRAVTRGIPVITDDRPRLEFTAPASYFHQGGLARNALAWVAARLDTRAAPIAGAELAPFALRAALLRAGLALLADDGPAELRAYLEAFAVDPSLGAARAALATIAKERLAAGDRATAGYIAAELRRRAPDAPESRAVARALAR